METFYLPLTDLFAFSLKLAELAEGPVPSIAAMGLFLAGTIFFRSRRTTGTELRIVPPPERPRLLDFRADLPDFASEISRARRYPHPLSIVVLRPETRALPDARTRDLHTVGVAQGANGNGSKASGNGAHGGGAQSSGSNGNGAHGNGSHRGTNGANGNGAPVALPVPLSAAVERLPGNGSPRPVLAPGAPQGPSREALHALGALLRTCVRDIDVAAYDETSGHLVLLLPETDGAHAQKTCHRLERLVLERTGTRLCGGIAEFRTHGLILEDLVHHATQSCGDPWGTVQPACASLDAASPQR